MIKDMLRYKRPAGSKTERAFIRKYVDSVAGMQRDARGNRYLAIGAQPTTLFSCHTDTMHRRAGMQELVEYGDIIGLQRQTRGDVLGADNAAGCYVALRLIAARVPGLYVFHRAEEIGGLGSDYIARHRSAMLTDIERAIAFDRRGQTDIITHQMLGRCCSDTFAYALAGEISMRHEPCAFGTFTDTANYGDLVPECTNVAVGYMLEHTHRETLDLWYLETLIDRLLDIDFDTLPTVRNPLFDNEYWTREEEDLTSWGKLAGNQ